jgi:hypothetical protein
MRWIGEGTELYSVRVDLVAPDDDHRWVSTAADALVQRLPFDSGGPSTLVGVDQGLGHEGLPVVGLTFLLRASGFGDAARLAVATATAAGADPTDREVAGIRVLNPGSVGLPRTLGSASWMVIDSEHEDASAEHRSVEFDVQAFVDALHRRRHPNREFVASVLARGTFLDADCQPRKCRRCHAPGDKGRPADRSPARSVALQPRHPLVQIADSGSGGWQAAHRRQQRLLS